MQTTVDATGPAPAGSVWENYMDPQRWPSWAFQIADVEYPKQRLTSGTSGRVEGPLGVKIDFAVLDVDESEWTWTWKAWWQHRSLGLTLTHGVATRTDGSRASLTIDGPAALVLPYAPVAKMALLRLTRH